MSTTAVKEKPILFSEPMVRALLDGRKTQTRRILKPQPFRDGRVFTWMHSSGCEQPPCECWLRESPYQVGQRLWVRETWCDFCPIWDGYWCGHGTKEGIAREHKVAYRATNTGIDHITKSGKEYKNVLPKKWRPSIHMPRWASRITLEITSVRVERLNALAEAPQGWADIRAEGIACPAHDFSSGTCVGYCKALVEKFAETWDSIYGDGAWKLNPWCWCIAFTLIREPRP